MYLINELNLITLLILFLLWGIGGWLLVTHWFHLEPHERGFVGFALGAILSTWFGNFLVRIMPISLAFWAAGICVLALGLVSAIPFQRDVFKQLLKPRWTAWFLFAFMVLVFTLIGRGLGMLDDFQNMPTVSLMATGDVPPHVPGRPETRYGYHYFLILLAVQFMRVGNAAPWTALDLARGLTLALAIVLAGMLAYRITRNKTAAWLSGVFFAFAGGTRWLMLLLPGTLLNRISDALTLIGSGHDTAATLADAFSLPWEVAGSGPIPFPFAFVNGMNPTSIMMHNGYGVSANLIMLLLILLAGTQKTRKSAIPFTVLLASLALANEVDFAILYAGILLVMLIWAIRNRSLRPPASAWFWVWIVVAAGIFALIQGGMFTEVLLGRLQPVASPEDSYFKVGFSVVLPTVMSSHLGSMSLFNPLQLLAALFEVGPVVLLLPLVLAWGNTALREEKWMQAALVFSTVPSLLSILIQYSGNAGPTATIRLLSNLFFMCKILAVPLLWLWLRDRADWVQNTTYALGASAILGGLVLFSIELVAIPHPVYTYFITDMDAQFYKEYWQRFSSTSTWIFDNDPSRATSLFGTQSESLVNWGVYTDEYGELAQNPDPYVLNAEGYSYVYGDKAYWQEHSAQLNQECIQILKRVDGAKFRNGAFIPDFRQLAQIDQCK